MKPNDILAMLEEAEKLAAKNHGLRTSRGGEDAPAHVVDDVPDMETPESSAETHTPDSGPTQQSASSGAAATAAAAASANVGEKVPLGKIDPVKKEVPADAAQTAAAPLGADKNAPRELTASWGDNVPTGHKSIVSKGLMFVFGFLLIFGLWAVLSPISSAVVAGGKIISTGNNKLVQHPDGGVVREILVRDGSQVKAGDLLLTLDRSAKQAELTRLMARQRTLLARKARYEAEQRGESVIGPVSVPATDDTLSNLRGGQGIIDEVAVQAQQQASPVLEEQRREFEAARNRLAAQLETIGRQIETFKEQKLGLEARLAGGQRLLALTERELSRVRPLADEGFLPKSRLWDLEKTQLEQITSGQNLRSEIEATNQRIAEATSKLTEIQENDREKRSEEMTKIIGELAEIRDQIPAAQTALDLTELRAPVAGTIVNLSANTTGGVVPAGQPIAEIVPLDAELLVEFRVPLNKAKQVQPEQDARVTITTLNRRLYDPIDATVTFVSADSITDEQTGESYFLARARMRDTPGKKTGIDEVRNGMAAEVYVVSNPRTFVAYVMQPLVDSFHRAFREQ
ncbi:HlyD family type I secretion periplasmic adaptor subunit [Pseudahrensia aquimaris]|uniref:Membrane fusion protein (MFP) family protein n=1 Tax=Pseudahrensia aquimaris TaxID=744461 RepID=A0ABW3FDC5_9HYPH